MKLFLQVNPNTILESQLPANQPTVQLDEIDAIADSLEANMGKEVKIPKDVLDSFKIKDTLNQDIWPEGKLNPKVRSKLIQVANSFIADMNLPKGTKIKDIIFTGSLANFNWSKFSDIDLHVVLDYNQFDADVKMVEEFFYAQKTLWNQEHEVTVFDYPIEVYAQNGFSEVEAASIYSILKDKWLVKPKHEAFTPDTNLIKTKAMKIINLLKDIRHEYNDKQYKTVVDKVTKLKDKIKQMRKAGLERGGEYSLENLVFKVLRRTPFMDLLDSYKAKAYDTLMSVAENLNEKISSPSNEDITNLLYNNDGFFNFENAKAFAKKFLGYNLTKTIGYGGNGVAYLTSKGTKLKFTFNENEYDFAKRSVGKQTTYMADYYKAEEIAEGIYVIEMEYIEPLPAKMKAKLKHMFDSILKKRDDYDKNLKAKVDGIKSKIGIWGNDLLNYDNYGIKNGELATYDPVSEEENRFLKGGVIILKGAPLEDGSQRLYVTTVNNITSLKRNKKDDSEGKPASMAILGNQIYKLSVVDSKLKAQGVAWNSEGSQLKTLGLSRRDVTLNNNKTPLHWETLKYDNIAQALNAVSNQIFKIPNVRWVG